MRTKLCVTLLALALGASVAACGNKAEEAQKEAQKKEAEAKAAQSGKDALAAAETAAAKKLADDMEKAHADVRAKLQKDADAADRKATYWKEKAAKTTGTVKKNADAAVMEVDKRQAAATDGIKNLATQTGAGWDTAKSQVESDVAAFAKSVEALETAVKAK